VSFDVNLSVYRIKSIVIIGLIQKEFDVMKLFFYILLNTLACSVIAEELHSHEQAYRQFNSHEHGTATLHWVLENQHLQLLLDSPAVNVLGFEHAPQNRLEKQKLENVIETLNQPAKVVVIKGGDCQFKSAVILNLFEDDSESEHHHEHKHEVEHSDLNAEYTFTCDKPSTIKSIDVRLFDTFSGFEKIESQWITDTSQGAITLRADSHIIMIP
jgi:hypothetical protein